MKIRPVLLLCLILLLPARIFAEGEGILYTGRVTKNMTIRATRSTSGKKLGGVAAGEFVRIREYGEKWTEIEADAGAEAGGSVTGYILSKNVEDLTERVLHEARVFITPGFIFGSNGERYIRISLCAKEEKIEAALERIKALER